MIASVARQGFALCAARDRSVKAAAVSAVSLDRSLEPLLPGFLAASAAMSRLVEQIERLQENAVEEPTEELKRINFKFPQPPRSGLKVIELEHVEQAYGDHLVYRDLNFTAERGQRIVLVGPNGAGKSTLLKILAGVIPIRGGNRELGGFRIRLSDNEMRAARAIQDAFQLRSTVAALGFAIRTVAQLLDIPPFSPVDISLAKNSCIDLKLVPHAVFGN